MNSYLERLEKRFDFENQQFIDQKIEYEFLKEEFNKLVRIYDRKIKFVFSSVIKVNIFYIDENKEARNKQVSLIYCENLNYFLKEAIFKIKKIVDVDEVSKTIDALNGTTTKDKLIFYLTDVRENIFHFYIEETDSFIHVGGAK